MLRTAMGIVVGLGLAGCGLPAEPLERAGVFKAMDDTMEDLLPEPELDAEARALPDLKDPQLQEAQQRLTSRHARFVTARERWLSTAGALDCALPEDLRWLLAKEMTQEAYARTYASMPAGSAPKPVAVEAVLLEGDCRDGRPEGDFVAVGTFEAVQHAGAQAVRMSERRRVEGTLRDGRFEDELLISGRMENASASGPLFTRDFHSLARYRAGELQGPSLTIADGARADGTPGATTTTVMTPIAPDALSVVSYVGSQLNVESTQVAGLPHGWMRIYDVRYVKDLESSQPAVQQVCYQHGRKAPDSVCAAGS